MAGSNPKPKPKPTAKAKTGTQTATATTTSSTGCPSFIADPLAWAACKAVGDSLPPAIAQFITDPVDAMERVGLVVGGSLVILIGLIIIGVGVAAPALGFAARTGRQFNTLNRLASGGSPTGPSPEVKEERAKRLQLANDNLALGQRKQALKEARERRLGILAENRARKSNAA